MCVSLDVDPLAPHDCTPDGELDFSLTRDSAKTIQLSCSQIPESQKWCDTINVSCFKVLGLGVICYGAIDNYYIMLLSFI